MAKKETTQKRADGWYYEANDAWHGPFATRKLARTARDGGTATEGAETTTEETSTTTEPETQKTLADETADAVSSKTADNPAPEGDRPMITLKLIRTNKSGASLYQQDGSKASIRFPKSLFTGEPPAEVQLNAPEGVLAAPGAVKASKTSDEVKAKVAANAEKAVARAQKAQERAAKALARAQKLGVAPATAPAETAAAEPVAQ